MKIKTALVTGASRGIGHTIALDRARNGADIALNHFGSQEEAEEVCELVLKEKVRSCGQGNPKMLQNLPPF